MLHLYTDGSCRRGRGCGWSYIILDDEKKSVIYYDSGFEEKSTNNRMEITAIINGLRKISEMKQDVTVYSDSLQTIKAMTGKCKKSQNLDLFDVLDKEVENLNISWEWVKGHNGDEWNQEVDKMAKKMALGKKISLDSL